MLDKNLKLNEKIFREDCEKTPMRKGFGEGLVEAARMDGRVVGLCADLTESTFMHLFREEFPKRFIELGVAEQNLASVASGMSAAGKIPVISSYAVFSPGRNWEQIRTTICYNNAKVIIAGSHAGVSVGPDGGSHQALEDIALMRVLPRMTILAPCDAVEAKKAVVEAIKITGPVYIRLARESTPVITGSETPFEIGKAKVFYQPVGGEEGESRFSVGIISVGAITARAIRSAEKLKGEGIDVAVMNLGTIKPLDEKSVLDFAKEFGAIVTAETHQLAGGMGGAIAEFLSANFPVPIEFVAVRDEFGQSGKPDELMRHYRLSEEFIEKAVKKVIERKTR